MEFSLGLGTIVKLRVDVVQRGGNMAERREHGREVGTWQIGGNMAVFICVI